MNKSSRINGQRLLDRIADFARIGATQAGGVNRQAFSQDDRSARRKITELALSRELLVKQDEAANLFISLPGHEDVPTLLIGSHLDSQPTGGRFDGALGSLAAFEALETIIDKGIATPVPIEVVIWSNEEGSRYAPGTMGSRAFADRMLPANAEKLLDRDGKCLADEVRETIQALPEAEVVPLGRPLAGYLELHIEQGPVLEAEGIAIGAVTGIQGTRWLEVRIEGESGHAGTTPLAARRDALATLIDILARLQAVVMPDDPHARMTVGKLMIEPGSINAIPSNAVATVDIRHPDTEALASIEELLRATVAEAARLNECTATVKCIFDMPSAVFDPDLVGCVEEASRGLALSSTRMVSGAFHDALSIQPLAPSAMVFVPCRGGISHNENEFVESESCVAGAAVLLEAALLAADRLAQSHDINAHTAKQKRMGT